MIKDNSDKLFLLQARLGFSTFTKKYHRRKEYQDLFDRRRRLNEIFNFSGDTLDRLENINDQFSKRSEEAYSLAERYESGAITEIKNNNPVVSDYEISFKVSLFSERKYSHIEELQGNPFFECEPFCFRKTENSSPEDREQHKIWLFKTNHTENLSDGQPVSNFQHCYLFHHLTDHTFLSYQDIIDIEEFWIEVVLNLQNFTFIS